MSVERFIQKGHVRAAEQRKTIAELNQLSDAIVRCERTIGSVMTDLESINTKYQGQRDSRQDVEYLTGLLDCAKRKLAWEKHIASLQKRAPALLEKMTKVLGDRDFPPTEEMKAEMLRSLKAVQDALQRLQPPGSEAS